MPLTAGTRLGAYEIQAAIGAGGMGEVYRATDTSLKRQVAIKVLPDALATDAERLARFQREAEVLASLNHHNIAAIYGIEEAPDVVSGGGRTIRALVMELVEGPTLADRIAEGPIPQEEAFAIARQIAEALDAAHETGIVHRDLKPANVKVRADGTVKVLDFGLAKAMSAAGESGGGTGVGVSQLATITTPAMTQAGVILGTAAYMSPEQARGKIVGKRADIWAYGCVLYEMLTGAKAFAGGDVSETLAAVLRDEPPLDRVPAPARTLISRCLEKDPKRRLRDIGDAMALLDAPGHASGAPASVDRRAFLAAAGLALVATIGMVALAVMHFTEAPPTAPVPLHFEVRPPGNGLLGPHVALSPDGRMVAFTATGGEVVGLWVHSFDTGASRRLASAGATGSVMFWSADNRYVAYGAGTILRKVSVADDQAQTIADIPVAGWTGGSWNADNVIIFGGASFGVMRVSANGGTPAALTVLDRARNDIGHVGPTFLPDGRRFLYFRNTAMADTRGIYVGSLDLAPSAQSTERIAAADSRAFYLPGPAGAGHLLFLRQGLLVAQAFDLRTLAVSGEPTQVAGQMSTASGDAPFAASASGTVLFRSNAGATGTPVWISRAGAELGAVGGEVMTPQHPRVSPDGKRMALVVSGEIWVYDLQGRPPVKVTFGDDAFSPVWTPDGKSLVYESNDAPTLLMVASSAGATPQPASPIGHFHPHGWSPDGRLIAAQFTSGSPVTDIVHLVPTPSSTPEFLVKTPGRDGAEGTSLSPDGKWLAYASNGTGTMEVWVQPFPGPGDAIRVSPRGGMEPVWARNGRELYYLERNRMMAVGVNAKQEFDFTEPVPLFDFRYNVPTQPPAYDVAPDGRFVAVKPSAGAQTGISVITNWAPPTR